MSEDGNGNGKIYSAMAGILADMEAVKKSRDNPAQRVQFRGLDDGMNAVNPL